MTQYKPLPSNQPLSAPLRSVTLRRWGGSVSLSLVFLACGGVADLKLGQDTSALENATGDDATGSGVAPGTYPSGGTPASGTTAARTPDGVFLVDPTTGQLYVPCSVGAGAASDEPPALEPDTGTATGIAPDGTPVSAAGTHADGSSITPSGTYADGTPVTGTGTAPDGIARPAPAAGAGTGTAPDGTPVTASGTSTGTAPDGTSVTPSGTGTAPDGTPITPSGTYVGGKPATDQPGPTTEPSVSGQPCGPVGYAGGGVPVQAPDTGGNAAGGTQPAPVAAEPATAPAPVRRTY